MFYKLRRKLALWLYPRNITDETIPALANPLSQPIEEKIILPTTENEWFSDLSNVENMRNILNTRVFQTGVALLKLRKTPDEKTIANSDSTNGKTLAFYAGYNKAFEELKLLATVPHVVQTKLPQPVFESWAAPDQYPADIPTEETPST